jgi:uncharacterized protein YoxC
MEQIMPFIFGMLTIIGIAAAVIIVVGIVKIFKQNSRFREVESTIERIWSHIDSNNRERSDQIHRSFTSLVKSIDDCHIELSKRIESVESDLNRRLGEDVSMINQDVDNLDSSIGTRIDDLCSEIDSRFDDVKKLLDTEIESVAEQLESLSESITEGDLEVAQAASDAIANAHRDIEEKARNTASYIDSRIDKVREEFAPSKKELLKG